jgi:hypothetical protein
MLGTPRTNWRPSRDLWSDGRCRRAAISCLRGKRTCSRTFRRVQRFDRVRNGFTGGALDGGESVGLHVASRERHKSATVLDIRSVARAASERLSHSDARPTKGRTHDQCEPFAREACPFVLWLIGRWCDLVRGDRRFRLRSGRFLFGPAWIRTRDQRIMSPLL